MKDLAKWMIPVSVVALTLALRAPAKDAPAAPPADATAPAAQNAEPTAPATATEPAAPESKESEKPAAPEKPASSPVSARPKLSTSDSPLPTTEPEAETQPATTHPTTQTAPTTQAATSQPAEPAIAADLQATADAMLAERFCEMGQSAARASNFDRAGLGQSAALLRAATTLDGNNSRYWQLLIEAELQLGDQDGVLSALQGYRAVAPQDRIAQAKVIELYASRIEKADEALKYLRGLFAREGDAALSPEVRSQVAEMIARRLLDRGEQSASADMIDQAIKLNPVNVSAVDSKYHLVVDNGGSAPERMAALIACVRANPVRPAVLGETGRLLAEVGLTKDAIEWMGRALTPVLAAENSNPNAYHDLFIDYVAELFVDGQIQPARSTVEQALKGSPDDIDGHLLQLIIERGNPSKEAFTAAQQSAAASLNKRWTDVAKQAGAEAVAADPVAVAAKAKESQDAALQSDVISALADRAWFEMYFNDQPAAAAKPIEALGTLLDENSVTLQRLRGWLDLSNKQTVRGRQRLEPLAGQDPLAALGMVLSADVAAADKDAQHANDDAARQLLRDHPSGLVGAVITQALKSRGLKPQPNAQLAAVRAELGKLPKGWLDLATNPQRFYSVRADPVRVACRYGEPAYVLVTITNLTSQDISIGDDGVIKPGLWFDADVQAMQTQPISGVAYERLALTTVLPAHAALPQYVRFDQGLLSSLLSENPTPRFQITGWCTINVGKVKNGLGPLAAGVRVPFARKVTRVGFPVNKPETFDKLFQELEGGLPDMKIRDLRLLGTYVRMARAANPPQQVGLLVDHISAATDDEIPTVAAWAKFELARVVDPDRCLELTESLLADKHWEAHLLGVIVASNAFKGDKAIALVSKVADFAGEEKPFVKDYAMKTIERLKEPPTTRPTTEPSLVPPATVPSAEAPATKAAPAAAAPEQSLTAPSDLPPLPSLQDNK